MNKQELIICIGLQASGKTTFSKAWVSENSKKRVRVCRDDIRRQLGPYWVPSREDLVTCIENSMIVESLFAGYSVIVDATNFKGLERFQSLITQNKLDSLNIEIKEQSFIHIPLEECIKRDSLRDIEFRVGEKVIREFYNKYLKK